MSDETGRRDVTATAGGVWARALMALLLAFVSIGTASPALADPKPPGAAQGTKLPYAEDPFALFASKLRSTMSVNRKAGMGGLNPWMNVAVELIDVSALTEEQKNDLLRPDASKSGTFFRGEMVSIYEMRRYLSRADFLKLANSDVDEVLAIAATSFSGVHSELALKKMLPSKARKLAGYSERRQCSKCAQYYDSDIPTFYSYEYDLTPEEIEAQDAEISAALKGKSFADPKVQKAIEKIRIKYEAVSASRGAAAMKNLGTDIPRAQQEVRNLEEEKKKNAAQDMPKALGLQAGCKKPAPPAGMPGRDGNGGRPLAMPLAGPCTGGTPSALDKALGSGDYGGVDFSTLEMRYMSDDPGSGGVRYSFSARPASPGLPQDEDSGIRALTDSTADLRTWLVLSPNKFWVNLNPTEPDRVVDAELGKTNAGRALLEADLRMKRTEGELLDPRTEFGARYWKALRDPAGKACYSSRLWITPGDVQVREDGGSLYILKASLAVQAKSMHGDGLTNLSCRPDPASDARDERLEQTMVVPKIVKAVNTAPEYAPLRRAFLARVVAQWIRERHQDGHRTSFDHLIDSGNLGPVVLQDGWRPRQVFDSYVHSIHDGEFTYKQTTHEGGTTFIYTMTFGGVDFSKLNPTRLDAAQMNQQHPRLPQTIKASTNHTASAPDGSVWLGATAGSPDNGLWSRTTGTIGAFLSGRTGILVLLLVALGVVTFGIRGGTGRKRRTS